MEERRTIRPRASPQGPRHAASEDKAEAKELRSAPGNARLESVKKKLKDAIDGVRLHSSPGSDSDDSDGDAPIASQTQQKNEDARHKAKFGDRQMAPRGGFCSTGRLGVLKLGAVTKPHTRGHACTWFEGGERAAQCKGRLQEWDKRCANDAEEGKRRWKFSEGSEARFQKLETTAGARSKPKPLAEETTQAAETKSVRKEVAKEVVGAPTEVGTWNSDAEDDEHERGLPSMMMGTSMKPLSSPWDG